MPIDKITGVAFTAIDELSGIAKASIANVSGIAAPSSGPLYQSTIYTFDNQTNATGSGWIPGGTNPNYATDGWVNGTSAVNGTTWGSTTVRGIDMDSGGTGSSSTGPNGGMTSYTDGTPNSAAGLRYMYKEASGSRSSETNVVRTPGYNFSTLMSSTANNLKMVLWYHAFGSNIVYDIYSLYTDTATTTNDTLATNLITLPASTNTMPNGSASYIKQEIDLSAYRTLNQTNYFWITIGIMSGFRGDVAIDSVYWEEY